MQQLIPGCCRQTDRDVIYALKTARWKTRGVFLDRHVRRKSLCCESLTTIKRIWCVCGGYCSWRSWSCLTFWFCQQLVFLFFFFCIRDVSCSKGLKWRESVWTHDSPRDSVVFFFRILIWIQLPEGWLAGVTWMWRGCDTRTQDGLVSWAVCWSGTVISQMSWDISCYIDSSCIIQEGAFGPQIALIMNYVKAICRKYINISRQLMQWEIDTMCSKDVRSYICMWIINTFVTGATLGIC